MSVDATSFINTSLLGISDGATRVPAKTLQQEDFLRLLVTQLRSQDPMNPQSDTDLAAQMAQFSALEQSRGMASNLSALLNQQALLQANSLLGRVVELQTETQDTFQGVVEAVQIEAGTPRIVVDGVAYALNQVKTITPPPLYPLNPSQ